MSPNSILKRKVETSNGVGIIEDLYITELGFLMMKIKFENKGVRYVNYNLGQADALLNSKEIKFNLSVSNKDSEKVSELLQEKGVKPADKLVIVHPGSGGSSVDLPKEKMIELTRKLSELKNVTTIITGSRNEAELCKEFEINKSIVNLAGQLNISLLKALINKADLLISNSTGPMHIAAALGVYVLGFFPKILSCSQKRWGPYTNKKTIFIPTIDCSNSTREQCE